MKQSGSRICTLHEACPAEEEDPQVQTGDGASLLLPTFEGDHFTKTRIRSFPQLGCVIAMQNALIKPFIRDTLEGTRKTASVLLILL